MSQPTVPVDEPFEDRPLFPADDDPEDEREVDPDVDG